MISKKTFQRLGVLVFFGCTLQSVNAAQNDISCNYPDDARSLAIIAVESLDPKKVGTTDALLLATLDKAGFGDLVAKWLDGANLEESPFSITGPSDLPLWMEHARSGDAAALAQDHVRFIEKHGKKEAVRTILARLFAIYAGPKALERYVNAISPDSAFKNREIGKSVNVASAYSDHQAMITLYSKQNFGPGSSSFYGLSEDLFWDGEHELLRKVLEHEAEQSENYRHGGPYRTCLKLGRMPPEDCREKANRDTMTEAFQALDIRGWSLCNRQFPPTKRYSCLDALEDQLRKGGFDPQPAEVPDNQTSRYADNAISYLRSYLLETDETVDDGAFRPFDTFSMRAIMARRSALEFTEQTDALSELMERFEKFLEIVPEKNAELALSRLRHEKLRADLAVALFAGSQADLTQAIEVYRKSGETNTLAEGLYESAKATQLKRQNAWPALFELYVNEPEEYRGFSILNASHEALVAGYDADAARLRDLAKQRMCAWLGGQSNPTGSVKTSWWFDLFTDAAVREGLLPTYFSGQFHESFSHFRF